MEKKEIWRVLGMEPVKDLEKIRDAYRTKLASVNPEDDPEGFKKLRTAFEEAQNLIKQEEEKEEEDQTPIAIWIKRAKDIYHTFSRRIDLEAWKELLSDPLCMDIDTSLEARDALLYFLADYFRLPSEVWKLLDEVFSLCQDQEELVERHPEDFISYVVRQCTNDPWFDYHLFAGPDDGDYDAFIQKYNDIRRKMDEDEQIDLEKEFEDIDELGIEHPYLEAERANYLMKRDKAEEAASLLKPIYEEYPEDSWILFLYAEAQWKNGAFHQSQELYDKLLDREPEHYTALVRKAQYYTKKEEYEKAKDFYISALHRNSGNEELMEQMRQVNEHIIEDLEKQHQEDREDLELALKLGWCCLQNNLYEKGVKCLEDLKPDDKNREEYESLSARLYFYLEDFDRSEMHLKKWIEILENPVQEPETKAEEDQKEEKDEDLSRAWSLLGDLYRKAGDKEGVVQTEREAYDEKAIQAMNQCISFRHNPGSLHQKAAFLLSRKRYAQSVDVCDEIVGMDNRYLPAYLIRQECFYQLRYARQVIDDFYHAYEIYPYYPKMYQWAATVYYDFEQYEDALDILEKAKQHQVASHNLTFLELKTKRYITYDREEREQIGKELCALETVCRQEKEEPKLIYQIVYENILCLMDQKRYDEAISECDRIIREDPSSNSYPWTKADIYMKKGNYKKALELYLQCRQKLPESESLLEDLGRCYERLGEPKEAVSCYQKILEGNPEHKRANSLIVDVYDELFSDTEEIEYFHKAMPYADRQVELVPEAYYYIERGLLYMDVNAWEKALKDFEAASEENPESMFAVNNAGRIYKYTGYYDKALQLFEKAISLVKDNKYSVPYTNLADCYERMGEFDKALAAYRHAAELFPEKVSIRKNIADLLRRTRQYGEAIKCLLEALELKDADRGDILTEIGDSYEEMNDPEHALEYWNQALKEDKDCGEAYRCLSSYHFNQTKNYKMAEKLRKKALALEDDLTTDYRNLVRIYAKMGKKRLAKKYFDLAIAQYNKEHGSLKHYLSSLKYAPARLFNIGLLYCYIGDYEEAEQCFKRILSVEKCRGCTYPYCTEYCIGMGMVEEGRKHLKEALNYYRKSLDMDPNVISVRKSAESLERKLTEK